MYKIQFLLFTLFVFFSASCKTGDNKDAGNKTGEINKILSNKAITDNPDKDGINMSAVIDGKKWVATLMSPDYNIGSNYKMIHGATKEYTISFNIYKPETGNKSELSDEYMISCMTDDGVFSGKKGVVEITMADEYWIEGNFHFIGTTNSSDKTIKVTNGFFRVAVNDPDK